MSPRKTGTPRLDELDELGRAVGAAKQRARAVELEHTTAKRDVEELQQGRVNALAADDDDLAVRLQAERDQAERAERDLADRLAAARLQAERAEADRDGFAQRELDVLLAEHSRTAMAAAEAVESALADLQSARSRWVDAESTTLQLLRLGGHARTRPAAFPSEISDLLRQLRRSSASIPPPLPANSRDFVSTAA